MENKLDNHKLEMLLLEMENIPFGNSQFQAANLTTGQESPERRYRHVLLQLDQKINALKECKFRRDRDEIDIEEIEEKLKTAEGYSKRRLLIDLAEKQWNLKKEIKLINDCLFEIDGFLKIHQTLPKITREQFEQAEHSYWQDRLLGDVKRQLISGAGVNEGTLMCLNNMGIEVARNDKGGINYLLPSDNKVLYLKEKSAK